MAYFIKQWDGIHLFTKILTKYDKKRYPESEFTKFPRLKYAISYYYNNKGECKTISEKIFDEEIKIEKEKDRAKRQAADKQLKSKNIINLDYKAKNSDSENEETESPVNYSPNVIEKAVHLLVSNIYKSKPIILQEYIFYGFTRYIKDDKFSDSIGGEIHDFLSKEEKIEQQMKFAGTKWWVYRFGTQENFTGVTRSLLHFFSFGKVLFESFYSHEDRHENFKGNYSVLPNGNFLEIYMKDGVNILSGLIHIGSGMPEIAIGQLRGYGSIIYSGAIILEKANEEDIIYKPYFTIQPDPENIPKHIWDYFQDPDNTMIITPSTFDTLGKFKKWIQAQKQDKTGIDEIFYNPGS